MNRASNGRIVETLTVLANQKAISVTQMCIAWVPSKGERSVPVVGARTRRSALIDGVAGRLLRLVCVMTVGLLAQPTIGEQRRPIFRP